MPKKIDTSTFIERAKSCICHKHIDYDYSKVKYVNGTTKVTIICPNHGEFEQRPVDHLNSSGCPKCAKEDSKITRSDFIARAKEIHSDKDYDYSKVKYVNTRTKVTIICPKHGEFEQTPTSHLHKGSGCPKCSHMVSKKESKWLDSMSVKCRQHRIGSYTVDGFDSESNTVYEFHGDFWHGNPKKYDRDFINTVNSKTMGELYDSTILKEEWLKDNGYNLVIMWESDWEE